MVRLKRERRDTFGQQAKDGGLRGINKFQVFPLQGGNGIKIKVHEVPNMTQISNEHIEVRKTKYFHLQDLSFLDVNHDRGTRKL